MDQNREASPVGQASGAVHSGSAQSPTAANRHRFSGAGFLTPNWRSCLFQSSDRSACMDWQCDTAFSGKSTARAGAIAALKVGLFRVFGVFLTRPPGTLSLRRKAPATGCRVRRGPVRDAGVPKAPANSGMKNRRIGRRFVTQASLPVGINKKPNYQHGPKGLDRIAQGASLGSRTAPPNFTETRLCARSPSW